LVPMSQIDTYKAAIDSKSGKKILTAMDSFYYPFNYMQPIMRAQILDGIKASGQLSNPDFKDIIAKASKALEESAAIEKYEPREYVRLVETYDELGKTDKSYYAKALENSEKALALSPTRQGLIYHYAFDLSSVGRYEDSIAAGQKAVDLDPTLYKSHYELAIVLSVASDMKHGTAQADAWRNEASIEMEKAIAGAKEQNYSMFMLSDFKNTIFILGRLHNDKLAAEVAEKAVSIYPEEKSLYLNLILAYRNLRDADGLIRAAESLKKQNPDLSKDIDAIINLAKNKQWQQLDAIDKQ
jgi:tetratricopeptide (TPR) repeat protein